MLVKFTENRALMVPIADGLPLLRIFPGVNEVEDATWNKVRDTVKTKLDAGKLVELHATSKKDQKGVETFTGKTLKDLDHNAAESCVKDCLDRDLLDRWKKLETRDSVRLAISNQLEELLKRPTAVKKSEE